VEVDVYSATGIGGVSILHLSQIKPVFYFKHFHTLEFVTFETANEAWNVGIHSNPQPPFFQG
jgi:hypothetical protein